LLVVADGPRAEKQGEAESCRQVRDIVSKVDWPCEVSTNFSDTNLGCDPRIVSGLDWVFSLVEEAIIFEDDCLPDASFFPFCRELLEKYRGDDRVAAISGTNLVAKHVSTPASYFFSQMGGNWGWATWRDEWLRYDRDFESWTAFRSENMLSDIFNDARAVAYWTRIFDAMYDNRITRTWDNQWLYTHWKNHSLTIIPSVNLVANIGFGSEGATHTFEVDSRLSVQSTTMMFPLTHPSNFVPLRSADRLIQEMFTPSLAHRFFRRIRISAEPLSPDSRFHWLSRTLRIRR
jgi:hypothetical protein